MSDIRSFSRRRWEVADLAQDLQAHIAADPLVHNLFHGATTLDQVVNLLTRLVLAEDPALLREQEPDQGTLLQMLSIGFRLMVIKSLEQEPLTQPEHLVCLLARHFAAKTYEPPLAEAYQGIAGQILGLFDQWDTQMRRQRGGQRNMMRHR
ncbi:hypothetical protein FCL40_08770 [Ferrimonas sediminicola]|uniref:Uncharacterized protein n=1 Tax=Ferrimonas sediminicola TaxID=2569538 RepID=A0A4U1BEW2_9GAMM|nr:hypothetical protein [Ferrimonas sediminicola]TKB49415.1 hypothetical protein FCL40_08770 [Ferrimonas sediminicola]